MPGLLLVNAQDVARSLGDDPNDVHEADVRARLEEDTSRREKVGSTTILRFKALTISSAEPRRRLKRSFIARRMEIRKDVRKTPRLFASSEITRRQMYRYVTGSVTWRSESGATKIRQSMSASKRPSFALAQEMHFL